MGTFLIMHGALIILASLVLLALAAALVSQCCRYLVRRVRHVLMVMSSIEVSEKVSTKGST